MNPGTVESYGSTDSSNLHGENILSGTDDEQSLDRTITDTVDDNTSIGDQQTLLSSIIEDTSFESSGFYEADKTYRVSNTTSSKITNHYNGEGMPLLNGNGSMNQNSSPTSSLDGYSDYERSEGGDDIQLIHGHGHNHNQARVAMNKPTFDALKDGGMILTKDENRSLTTILAGIITICIISIVFLHDLMASNYGHRSHPGGGSNGATNPGIPYFPFPDGTEFASNGGLHSAKVTSAYVPFNTVDRGVDDGTIPASDIVFPELFHSSLRASGDQNSDTESIGPQNGPMPLFRVPFPTGAFWTNFVIKPTADRGFSYPIMSYPYGYKWNPSILQVSYPPLRRLTDNISIRDIFNPDMSFSIDEKVSKRNVVNYDPLSVTVRFYENQVNEEVELQGKEPHPDTNYWESYLVQGSPYITIKYQGVTPIFKPLSIFQSFACPRDADGNYKDDASESFASNADDPGHFGICSKGESKNERDVTLQGVQFLIQTRENLTWMCFASKPITLTFDGLKKRSIRSEGKFDGVLRFALLPPQLNDNNQLNPTDGGKYENFPLSDSLGVKRLIYHAHTYPIGAKVSWNFRDVATSPSYRIMKNRKNSKVLPDTVTIGTVNFEYETRSLRGPEASHDVTPLLMLGLPHHAQVIPAINILKDFDLQYQTIKGIMAPIVGNKWSYDEPLTNIEFDDPLSMEKLLSLNPDVKQVILDQVEKDLGGVLPNLNEDVYGYGKQVARLAQLAHIAHALEQPQYTKKLRSNETSSSTQLSERATGLLHDYLTVFLDGSNEDNLVYDISFGGITTKNGIQNQEADFGSGWYNDHHFHYGYILYASSILGKLNTTFISEYGSHVDSIFYDVAHEANLDSDISSTAFFPFTRHKSWFDGHSFASGLFPFGNGKSQESSSEAVNCYYGAYLWSSMRWRNVADGGDRIKFAKLLLAMEIRGAKTYWHMLDPSISAKMDSIHSMAIYKPSFEKSLMVGNLGMMDVTISTWFGNEKLYVHMINFIPVTSITKDLFDPTYVEKEFNTIIKPMYDQVEMAWKGYCVADRAMIQPNESWLDATKLRSYELDSALSLSQLFYWISSMEGFNDSALPGRDSQNTDTSNAPDTHDSESARTHDAACQAHQRCADLGLGGFCCPSPGGTYLDCC